MSDFPTSKVAKQTEFVKEMQVCDSIMMGPRKVPDTLVFLSHGY